eukprot:GHVU01087307.1.p1 GENE.GHVU01087307.1~~GHVU01087307.1.p1  ORF type:complete len:107 (-),score=2.60 GHVU01087307.1:54-374(-)
MAQERRLPEQPAEPMIFTSDYTTLLLRKTIRGGYRLSTILHTGPSSSIHCYERNKNTDATTGNSPAPKTKSSYTKVLIFLQADVLRTAVLSHTHRQPVRAVEPLIR